MTIKCNTQFLTGLWFFLKKAKGHFWDNWGELNMNHLLENRIVSVLNFMSMVICCGYVGDCIEKYVGVKI